MATVENERARVARGPYAAWRGRWLTLALAATLALAGLGTTGAGRASGPESQSAAVAQGGRPATIANSGDGVLLRDGPAFGAGVVTALADGTEVALRIDAVDTVLDPDGSTRWWPVAVYGLDGWVAGYFLVGLPGDHEPAAAAPTDIAAATGETVAADAAADETDSVPADGEDVSAPAGDVSAVDPHAATARVADPEGINLRAGPSNDTELLRPLAFGQLVELRIDEADTTADANGTVWWPVRVDGVDGWVVGAFLGPAEGTDEAAPAPSEDAAPAAVAEDQGEPAGTAAFAPGTYAAAAADGGVNIRAEAAPSAEIVGFVSAGDVVQVMDGPASFEASAAGWYLVTADGVTGYADGDLLAAADQPAAPVDGDDTDASDGDAVAQPGPSFAPGDTVSVDTGDGDAANLRETVTTEGAIVGALAPGAVVEVLEGPVTDGDGAVWYRVGDGGVEGWVYGAYLTPAAPAQEPTEELAEEPAATTAPTSAPDPDEPPTAEPTAPPAPEPTDEPAPEPTDEPEPTEPPAPDPTEAPAPPASGLATGSFVYPTNGTISQNYGCSSLPFYPYDPVLGCGFHNGLDIAAPSYTPIVASDGGVVTFAGWCDCGLGYYVEIDHGNGFATVYGHMATQPYVATGQSVAQGETIGPIGSTGASTGPHTHFMVKLNGNTIDPLSVLS